MRLQSMIFEDQAKYLGHQDQNPKLLSSEKVAPFACLYTKFKDGKETDPNF